ncbi:protein of unknown function [Xylanibacter ruminicola]|jgi:hypothetical protein|uniref:Lipoprotein n=1 Tax=Xylanibacter ruminicola TaxID=839 RepID=A0A1H5S2Q0_XYLRU|nr:MULTISPECIES: DUF4827 domain-containing protein [Prevotellaceae]SEF44178.1 protein of unknown function [Xylanibacter ruminicola]SEW12134.1 protein of unknown function [Prevotella sp. khp7]
MKKLLFILIAFSAVLASCNDYETYGDKKEKERNAVAKFIADSSIVVISEDAFNQQGHTTNLSRNEFVKLDKTGVYMQIVREGCGTKLEDGENTNLVCRFEEFDIMNDTLSLCNNRNNLTYYGKNLTAIPDIMKISRTSGSYTASFTSGMMYSIYGATVPAGWLVALPYIKVGRPQSADEEYAKIRLIVPHSQGHANASSNVIPYYYVITFQRES